MSKIEKVILVIAFFIQPPYTSIAVILYFVYKIYKFNKENVDRCYLCKRPAADSSCFHTNDGQLCLHDTCLDKIGLHMSRDFVNSRSRSEMLHIIKNEIKKSGDSNMKKKYFDLLSWIETDKNIINAQKVYKESVQDRLDFLNKS